MITRSELFEKYLGILNVKIADPTLFLLRQIVKAHQIKIPFENISKLIYKKQGLKHIPDLSTYLDGVVKFNFGGTCYSNNYYLYLLLEHLGYDIKLCGADMKIPDVHLVSVVTIDEKEYIVDCGYAAPFFEPLPIDPKNDFEIKFGPEKYIVKPKDESGKTKVEQYLEDKLQHWYLAKSNPRNIEEFRKVIEDSYSDDATFMNAIRITKFSEKGSLVLKNLYLTEINGDKTFTEKISLDEIPTMVQKKFGMPSVKVNEAVGCLKELKDIYE